MIRLTSFAGQRVAVFGLGGSGLACARALDAGGADVLAWDDNAHGRERAQADGFNVCDIQSVDFGGLDALVLSPGVPLTHPKPHWVVARAHDAGCPVIGDMELFFRQRAVTCPDAPVVAITGTNGKSTTTALIAHLLRALGCDVEMGGNIGKAVLTLEPPSMSRVHVLEVSSYQIDLAPSLMPTVGVLLNLSPDHLDRHGTMEHYASVKERLVSASERVVVGVDDAWTRDIAQRTGGGARVYPITIGKGSSVVPQFYAIGTTLFSHERSGAVGTSETLGSLEGAKALKGPHNVQNALAGVGCVRALADWWEVRGGAVEAVGRVPYGELWDVERLMAALKEFSGLPHRFEIIGRKDGVLFINDSKATNANSTQTALSAFDGGIYWIAGGLAKDGGIEPLAPLLSRVAKAYLIGAAADAFGETLDGRVVFEKCGTLERAVEAAARDAAVAVSAGRNASEIVVLLSPACASFDQFANFEVRGDAFRRVVADLGVAQADKDEGGAGS